MGKTIMNRITLILATVLSLTFTQAFAKNFKKGYEVFQAGNYTTALKWYRIAIIQGVAGAQFKPLDIKCQLPQ